MSFIQVFRSINFTRTFTNIVYHTDTDDIPEKVVHRPTTHSHLSTPTKKFWFMQYFEIILINVYWCCRLCAVSKQIELFDTVLYYTPLFCKLLAARMPFGYQQAIISAQCAVLTKLKVQA
jgi:hypothetical protein